MYFYAHSLAFATAVVIHRGASSEAEHESYIETFLAFDKRHRERDKPVFILVAGGEAPNATSRKRIAEASRNVNPNALVVFVSDSALIRGSVTAVNWLRRPPYDTTVAKDIEETMNWIDTRRPGIRGLVERLYREALAAADRGTPRVAHSPRK